MLHDLLTGATDHLPHFLDELDTRGVEVRADTPDTCTPIRRGLPTESIGLLGPEAAHAAVGRAALSR